MAKSKVGLIEWADSPLDVHNLPLDLLSIVASRKLDDLVKSIANRLLNGNTSTIVGIDTGVLLNIASAIA